MLSYDQMSPCWIWWNNTLSGHYWRHQNGVTSKKWHSHELHFSDIINDSCCVETCYKLAKKRQWNAGVDYICLNVLAKLLCWVVSGSSTHHDTLVTPESWSMNWAQTNIRVNEDSDTWKFTHPHRGGKMKPEDPRSQEHHWN